MKAKSKADATSVFLRGLDAIRILFLVLELEHIDRAQFRTDFMAKTFVKQRRQSCSGADRHMEIAFWADLEVGLKLWPVQNSAAAIAFFPEAFGHASLAICTGFGADACGHQFFKPAHWEASPSFIRRIGMIHRPRGPSSHDH
jgi:hypothetical protein